MSEVWKRWEGQVADHKYHLRQYLGGTDHSAVFLAEFRDPEPRQAAVKFTSADVPHAEQQLSAWNSVAQLSHPNLLRVYGTGRCMIEDREVLYVAMEYAEENLSQVLPQRALLAEETREMLNAVAGVLVNLHGKNLAHGHIKPSNILAIGDLLKLSSDTILPAGEVCEMRRERSAYDAPELPASPHTPAADIWSLGVTLVEALTQQPTVLPFNEESDPVIPPAVREPFAEIARNALRRDPQRRWTSAQVAEWLNPLAAATKAVGESASAPATPASPATAAPASLSAPLPVSPLNVPLSKEPAIPLGKLPPAQVAKPPVVRPPVKTAPRAPRHAIVLPSYVAPLLAAVLVLIAIIALPKILRRREQSASTTVASSVSAGSTSAPAVRTSPSASRVDTTAKQPTPSNAAPNEAAHSTAPEQPALTPAQPLPATSAPAPEPAVLRGNEAAPAPTPKTSSLSPMRGEAIDQILPKPPAKALATIQGTVRIIVKVNVDAAGNVSEATLATPSSSKYFADLALKAARGWVFNSPETDGRSVPSRWVIRFDFAQGGVKAFVNQTNP